MSDDNTDSNMTAKPKLLVVDDDLSSRVFAEILLKKDYDVTTAQNAEDALRKRESTTAFLLSDFHLSKCGGQDGVQLIKQMGLPSILMSSDDLTQLRISQMYGGNVPNLYAIVKKPISIDVGNLIKKIMDEFNSIVQPSKCVSAAHQTDAQSGLETAVKKKRAIVIDDEFDIRDITSQILSVGGYEVDSAENGLIGAEMVASQKYDVAIMDKNMPVMDGYQSIRKIRESENPIKIILTTGNPQQTDLDFLNNGSIQAYVQKPYRIKEFMALVEKIQQDQM